MSVFAQFVLYAYIPFCVLLYAVLPAYRAFIWSWLLGFLFLPQGEIVFRGIPELNRIVVCSYGTLIGTIVFAPQSIAGYRISIWDIPLLVFCLVPTASSLSNGLTVYDGLTATFGRSLEWLVPYFLGRVLLTDYRALYELALALVIGGILYLPLCWFEMRMSPQLHRMVYGYLWRFQGERLGGWRPQVFLHSGLPLGIWMTAVCFLTLGLRRLQIRKKLLWIPYGVWWILVPITTVLCRSTGALGILALGFSAHFASVRLQSRLVLIALALVPTMYSSRAYLNWRPEFVSNFVAEHIDVARSRSFNYRVINEDLLIGRALQRPILGWGGYNRHRVFDEHGRDMTVTDGLWVIELGRHGAVGLATLLLIHMLPLLLLLRVKPPLLFSPVFSPILLLGIVPTLYMIDYLPNGMPSPLPMVIAGGLQTFSAKLVVAKSPKAVRRNAAGTVVARKML